MKIIRYLICLFLFPMGALSQTPTTIPKGQKPPDIQEVYKANPHFYEVMSAFPNDNSYYKYDLEEVKKKAKSEPEYMTILGDHYRIGRKTPMDHKKAIKEYLRAFAKGNAKAGHRIAYMYADGLGVPQDNDLFIHWLKQSANAGYDLAQYDLALIYLNGKMGLPRDFAKAYPYLIQASTQKHRGATELLGMISIHPASASAGIPTGLGIALDYFKKAGDTDNEKALLNNINSLGSLRYYLRVIPGFLPGIEPIKDTISAEYGIDLLEKLKSRVELTGEDNYQQYRKDIAENILYNYYFEAQKNRVEMLRFLLWCYQHDEWLAPYHERYQMAVSRDFRLSVKFATLNELQTYLEEFKTYPDIFPEEEMKIVSDRVFIALFLKESSDILQSTVADFVHNQIWLHKNLSSKYIFIYEQYCLVHYREILKKKPYEGGHHLDALVARLCQYDPIESDTLTQSTLPEVRRLSIHPYLTDHLFQALKNCKLDLSGIESVINGLSKSSDLIRKDPDRYIAELIANPDFLGIKVSDRDTDYPALIETVRHLLLEEGKKHLTQLCLQFGNDPSAMIKSIEDLHFPEHSGVFLKDNRSTLHKMKAEAWGQLIHFQSIICLDPNDVAFPPITTWHTYYDGMGCDSEKKRVIRSIQHPSDQLQWKCHVQNLYQKEVEILVVLFPIYDGKEPDMKAIFEMDPSNSWHSDSIKISYNESYTFVLRIDSLSDVKALIPVIYLPSQSIAIPWDNH